MKNEMKKKKFNLEVTIEYEVVEIDKGGATIEGYIMIERELKYFRYYATNTIYGNFIVTDERFNIEEIIEKFIIDDFKSEVKRNESK